MLFPEDERELTQRLSGIDHEFNFPDPRGNHAELVAYRDVQHFEVDGARRSMDLALEKTDDAGAQRRKGGPWHLQIQAGSNVPTLASFDCSHTVYTSEAILNLKKCWRSVALDA